MSLRLKPEQLVIISIHRYSQSSPSQARVKPESSLSHAEPPTVFAISATDVKKHARLGNDPSI